MLRVLTFLLFTTPAFAQGFSLLQMPPGWNFTSIEGGDRVTVTFVERREGGFYFDIQIKREDGSNEQLIITTNDASQTTRWQKGNLRSNYFPHDCMPTEGECRYIWEEGGELVYIRTFTEIKGDIWVADEYSKSGDEWLFYRRTCSTYDEYGFWYDYVRTYWDGETESAFREREGETRLDELWNICAPERLNS